MHPTDSELLALVHHEHTDHEPAELRRHLAICEACELKYHALLHQDRLVGSLLASLEHPLPQVSLAQITRQARRARRPRMVAAAVAALIAAASAAAATIPGSPFHPFFRTIIGKASLQTRPALRPAPAPADTAGVTVAADSEVTIALRQSQSAGEIRVIWQTDAPAVSVRAVGGEVGYTVRAGRVLVENRRPAMRYEITVPRSIPAVTLMVGDQVLWQSRTADAGRSRQPLTFDLSRIKQSRE